MLASAIKDEAKLLCGIPGDILFIRDEMDSMNGFLLHLTKMDTEHDDQVRTWMKQVRDIANLVQDYIRLYLRDLHLPDLDSDGIDGGLCARIRQLQVLLRTWPTRHALAKKIAKLKSRVRDVGERRLRCDVRVPAAKPKPRPPLVSGKDSEANERDAFLRALEEPYFDEAIRLLPFAPASKDGEPLHDIINKDHNADDHVDTMKMLLRALYAYPHGTREELEKLRDKLKDRAPWDVRREVMVFCYSKLSTHYKSCLQYLTTFLDESSISRTSLVRRWVAEGLVASEEGLRSMEEAGERCFNELVFRGFICPMAIVATGLKIKSCTMDDSVRDFVIDMAESENFVAGDLTTHFNYQLEIRKIVLRQQTRQSTDPDGFSCYGVLGPSKPPLLDADDKLLHPMDEIARLLKGLPQGYRLNVLDLGGCRGLEKRHLKIICKVPSLKYLSLRYTNVSWLPKAINNLWQLETLDVRQTHLRWPNDTERIYLPRLKHLLAGHIVNGDEEGERFSTVRMPRKINKDTESLNIKYCRGSKTIGYLPSRISGLKLLRKLTLRDTQLLEQSLCILGKLESLCCLRLHRGSYIGHTIRLNKGEFDKLRLLLIDHLPPTLKAIAFHAEAAPNLEKVVWTVDMLELNGDWTGQQYLKEALAENKKCLLVRYSSPDPDSPFDEKSHDVFVEAK
ncbi:hypothetical protein BS78_K131900 [Paspalum vaginatum]|uniref:Rx N-terminal domain-containing protein n=1 Tax=Paspalum vaginatum TaxID=158149 RepID=A0A9W7XC72_9POAL|nr:hypothetical protein BS78_K131900 [Paspalum vaginatum]